MRLGRWELVKPLGRGGMGEVWLARDPARGEEAALKLLLPGSLDAGQRLRFEREAQVLRSLRHPGVVAWLDHGEEAGRPWVAMEVLYGGSLRDLVRRRGPLPIREGATLVRELAVALAAVHQAGVIHRDLKPANVLFDGAGVPRLTDFGLASLSGEGARLTATGVLMGSPGWLAPEQVLAAREHVGTATDVYALGAILFFLLTGQPPFPELGSAAGLQAVVHAPAPTLSSLRLDAPRSLENIVRCCLAKSPAERLQSAVALRAALDGWLEGPARGGDAAQSDVGGRARRRGPARERERGVREDPPVPPAGLPDRVDAAPPASASSPASSLDALMERAVTRGAAGDHSGALEEYERARVLAPDDPRVWHGIATARYNLQDLEAAERAYDQVLALPPKDAAGAFVRADAARHRGDLRGAIEALDRALALDPAHAFAFCTRSELHLLVGEPARALRDGERAVALAPGDAKAYLVRGNARRAQGDREGAFADLEQAIALDPTSGHARLLRGEEYRLRGDVALALEDMEIAVGLAPHLTLAWALRGVLRGASGDEGGLADIEHAIGLEPTRAELHRMRGSWHLEREAWQLAAECFERAVALDPRDPAGWYGRGAARYPLGGDEQVALADLDQALAIDPRFLPALHARAMIREQLGDLVGAEADLVRVIELTGRPMAGLEAELSRVRTLLGRSGE